MNECQNFPSKNFKQLKKPSQLDKELRKWKKVLLLIGGLTAVAAVPISITTTLLIKKNKQQNINQNKIEKLQDELKLLQSQIANLEKDKTQMAQYADSANLWLWYRKLSVRKPGSNAKIAS
nr:hypothetical protein [Mycoplasmopsis bovis]